jgi:hypothetical protein
LLKALKINRIGLANLKITANLNELTELAGAPILNQVVRDRIDVIIMVHGFYLNPNTLKIIYLTVICFYSFRNPHIYFKISSFLDFEALLAISL